MVTWRTNWLALLAAAIFALTAACDSPEAPLDVRNATVQPVSISVLDMFDAPARTAKAGGLFQNGVIINPEEQIQLYIDRIGPAQRFTFIVQRGDGSELFRRTLTSQELRQRQRCLVITETGIE